MADQQQVVGGDASEETADKSRTVRFKLKKSLVVGLLVLIIVVAVVGAAGSWLYRRHNQALVINGTVVLTREQYNQAVVDATKEKVSASDAKATIISAEKNLIALKQLGIMLANVQLQQAGGQYYSFSNFSQLNTWQQLRVQQIAIANALPVIAQGGYHGYVFIFPYVQHFIKPSIGSLPNKFGDAATIANDKSYAKSTADDVRSELASHQTTDVAVLQKLQADSRLLFVGAGNGSTEFVVNKLGASSVNGSSITQRLPALYMNDILKLSSGGFTDVKTQTDDLPARVLPDGYPSPTDTAYYFVHVVNTITPRPTISTDLKQAVAKLRVVQNV